MFVIATAGHVDHGKSTLVKALTGMEPDRWAEERARGLTIDLGFVWTQIGDANVAFVDVPGHERFIGNMLAGVGAVPAVMFVVAADEGWQAQSTDHRDALRALGIEHGIVALARADRASSERRAEVTARVEHELPGWPVVEVSAVTGEGMDSLRAAISHLVHGLAKPDASAPVRVWIDRSFSVKGAGTVVTGTLTAGTLRVGDRLQLIGNATDATVDVRGLHSENTELSVLGPVTRAAVNLRGAGDISRGDALVTPGAWPVVAEIDVRRTTGADLNSIPGELTIHVGTARLQARVRDLGAKFARLRLSRPVPLALGDRMVLRAPGSRHVLGGVEVVDLAPPELTRRGDAARRSEELAARTALTDATSTLIRHGALRVEDLAARGFDTKEPPKGIIAFRGWWIHAPQVTAWKKALIAAVHAHAAAHPLSPGMTRRAAMDALALPGEELLGLAIAAAQFESREGLVMDPNRAVDLGAAESGVANLEETLSADPFAAPESADLERLNLGPKELAAAERAGRLLRVANGIVLLPSAPATAAERLASLEQPFTTSQARQALGTTRRVAIPLLEYLDAHGVTRRLDGQLRRLR